MVVFEPFVIETGPKCRRPPGAHRIVLDCEDLRSLTESTRVVRQVRLRLPSVSPLVRRRGLGCDAEGTECQRHAVKQRSDDRLRHC